MNPNLFFDSIPPLLQPHFLGSRPLWDVLDTIGDMIWDIATRARKDFDEIENGIFVGHGTRIDKNVVIYGPAIIGAHCHIRSSAYIRENVIIGNNCTIGNSTEVKNAILFNHVDAPHFNYIGDSIL